MKIFKLIFVVFALASSAISQEYEWVKSFGGDDIDEPVSSVICQDGGIAVIGNFEGTFTLDPEGGAEEFSAGGTQKMWVRKTDSNGTFLWGYAFTTGTSINGFKIDTDNEGNLYLYGIFEGSVDMDPGPAEITTNSDHQSYLLKLDSEGHFIWLKTFDFDRGTMTVSPAGDVIVTGRVHGTVDLNPNLGVFNVTGSPETDFTSGNCAILKLDTDGEFLWGEVFEGGAIEFLEMEVLSDGNIFCVGHYFGDLDIDPSEGSTELISINPGVSFNILNLKLDVDGGLIWYNNYSQTHLGTANNIIEGLDGNCFISGYFRGTIDIDPGADELTFAASETGLFGAYIQKLDTDGNLLWAKTHEGVVPDPDILDPDFGIYIGDLQIDVSGNLYAYGYAGISADFDFGPGEELLSPLDADGGSANIYIQKIEPDGDADLIWSEQIGRNIVGRRLQSNTFLVNDIDEIFAFGRYFGTVDFDPNEEIDNRTSLDSLDVFMLKLSPCGSGFIGDTLDSDGDGVFDICDLDDDNDGIPDSIECGIDPPPVFLSLDGEFTYTSAGLPGGVGDSAYYKNAGFWMEDSIDFSIIVMENTDPINCFADISREPYVFGGVTYVNMLHLHALGDIALTTEAKLKYSFYKSDTGEPISIPAEFRASDIDNYASDYGPIGTEYIEFNQVDVCSIIRADTTNIELNSSALSIDSVSVGNFLQVFSDTVGSSVDKNLQFDVIFRDAYSQTINFRRRTGPVTGYTFLNSNSPALTDTIIVNQCCDRDTDGDGVPDHLDLDSDNDGIPDIIEDGGTDENGDGRIDDFNDEDGNGADDDDMTDGENDTDGDGVPDYTDLDSDNDGIPDIVEDGGTDENGDGVIDDFNDEDGDGADDDDMTDGENDTDGDGVPDYTDLDSDNDGIPDVIEDGGTDENGDGRIDDFNDEDGDGADDDDMTDGENDTDGDGVPDYTDLDSDNDGIPDIVEDGGTDENGDGVIDDFNDEDGDGADDDDMTDGENDTDGDGVPDYTDLDSDNDGIPDVIEDGGTDENGDGRIDDFNDEDGDGADDDDMTDGENDTDGDGVPDYTDLDSDNDGIPDIVEDGGTDENGDGVIDDFNDEDGDGADDDDMTDGENDTDGDGVPDYTDLDSDNDGVLDENENDPNGDGEGPDDTDGDGVFDFQDPDDDNDQIPTEDEIAEDGSFLDCDGDGIPDHLDLDQCLIETSIGFSPNGDGKNDLLFIPNALGKQVTIYSRWGILIFSSDNYQQNWDGRDINTGEVLPTGYYFFVVEEIDEITKGYIYLTR